MFIKFLILVFVLFALTRVYFRYRKNEIIAIEFFSWFTFWILVAVATLWHRTTDIVANFLGVSRGADLLVYISIIVLFFLVFKILVKTERIERNITKIVREVVLQKKTKKLNNQNNRKE